MTGPPTEAASRLLMSNGRLERPRAIQHRADDLEQCRSLPVRSVERARVAHKLIYIAVCP